MSALPSTQCRQAMRIASRNNKARAKLLAIPEAQWDAWRAERWSMARIAAATGVSRLAVATVIHKFKGGDWPKCVYAPRETTGQRRPKTQPSTPVPTKWTWHDYAEQCDREFATPHYLRQAPAIKAWLEATGVKP